MKNNEQTINYLNAIFQNTKTALQSISDILPQVKNPELVKELEKEKEGYNSVAKKCKQFAEKYDIEIKDNNFMEKARLWTSIKVSTLMNKQTRHIAEMLLLGTNMGIVTCYKDRFDHRGVNENLDIILENLENLEVANFNSLKPFLNEE